MTTAAETSAPPCRCGHSAAEHEGDLFGRYSCAWTYSIVEYADDTPHEITCGCTAYLPRGGA